MARHRAELGLPPDPDNNMPFRHLHLCFTPPAWDGAGAPRPANAQFFRHENAIKAGTSLPDWVDELADRPTVLASLGTVFNTTPGVLEAILAGLAQEPVNLIVAIGPDQDPARFGAVPANVRLEPWVPQTELLPRCAAFVTHGGFNSVKESLLAGVPMVLVPITADQPYCAQRCAALGVGEVVGSDDRTPERIRQATHAVLAGAHRTRAVEFRNQMLALPGPGHAVELLEHLVAPRTDPVPSGARTR